MTMHLTRRPLLIAVGASLTVLAPCAIAHAATPKDTLVEAFAIDDIISLDPAESFELSAAEIISNCYSQLVRLDVSDTTKVVGDLADTWTTSPDGLTYTFKLKPSLVYASGNPVTAEDIAWSFERMVKLDKSPGFLIQQLGLTGDNVTEKAKAADATTFVLTVDKPYAPSFVLNVMAASPISAVDKKIVLQHVKAVTPSADYKFDNDFGNAWLKTNYAGSGPFVIRTWKANELAVMERKRQVLWRESQACPHHLPAHEGERGPASGTGGWRRRCRTQP